MPRVRRKALARHLSLEVLEKHLTWCRKPWLDIANEDALLEAWTAQRDELLPAWIEAHPGTRPLAWWAFDVQEQRRLEDFGGDAWREHEQAEAKKRQSMAGGDKTKALPVTLPEADKGDTRDKIGERVGDKAKEASGNITGSQTADWLLMNYRRCPKHGESVYEREIDYLQRCGMIVGDELARFERMRIAYEQRQEELLTDEQQEWLTGKRIEYSDSEFGVGWRFTSRTGGLGRRN